MRPELAVLQEIVDIVPGAPLRRTDRARFLRALGVDVGQTASLSCSNDATSRILRHVGDAAYEMPLPPRWTEQVDVRGFVYFSHALQSEATWEHPLLDAFRETMEFARKAIDSKKSLDEAASTVSTHLQTVQDKAVKQLNEWSGPYKTGDNNDEFFFNESTGQSSWVSPVEVWQYELHARYWLLVQLLQQLHVQHGGDEAQETPVAQRQTPRFLRSETKDMSNLLEETGSAMESSLSFSGISAAVRSHATEIASSLASAPSFSGNTRCFVCTTPTAEGSPNAPPRPPPKPPPPLRHLAAPPRLSDVPPETVLRAPSPALKMTPPAEVAKPSPPASPPPPPGLPTVGQVVRRVQPKANEQSAPPPPPPPRRLDTVMSVEDFEPPKAPPVPGRPLVLTERTVVQRGSPTFGKPGSPAQSTYAPIQEKIDDELDEALPEHLRPATWSSPAPKLDCRDAATAQPAPVDRRDPAQRRPSSQNDTSRGRKGRVIPVTGWAEEPERPARASSVTCVLG